MKDECMYYDGLSLSFLAKATFSLFVLFHLVIVLSVLLRYIDSDYSLVS